MNITVLIPTFNCEQTILKTLNSVMWADQIVVVDSFSTDSTLKLIKSFKVNLYQNKYNHLKLHLQNQRYIRILNIQLF